MNVVGRMDYVSYKGIKDFEKEDRYGEKIYENNIPKDAKDLDARKVAFQPGNPLAEYLACSRKLVLKIGDYLFVHAGILPIIAEMYPNDAGIEEMNNILTAYLFNMLDKKEIVKSFCGGYYHTFHNIPHAKKKFIYFSLVVVDVFIVFIESNQFFN